MRKQSSSGLFSIVALVSMLQLASVVQAQPAPKDPPRGREIELVKPLPLPVTGDVGVSGTIDATVTNFPPTQDVNVTNTPEVTVVNEAGNPVPVAVQGSVSVSTPGIEPYAPFSGISREFDSEGAMEVAGFSMSPAVPDGKLGIVEYLSCTIQSIDSISSDLTFIPRIRLFEDTSGTGGPVRHMLIPVLLSSEQIESQDGSNRVIRAAFSDSVKIHLPSGARLAASIVSTSPVDFRCHATGQLIDAG